MSKKKNSEFQHQQRKKKNKNKNKNSYSNADIANALKEYRENGKVSIRAVSKKFNIPRSSLGDILRGRAPEEKPVIVKGPRPYLTIEGENQIIE